MKRSAVEGTIAVGGKVVVAWGKSKKKHNAEVLNVGGKSLSPDVLQQHTGAEDEPFTFELVQPAPQTSANSRGDAQTSANAQGSPQNLSSITEKLECLADAIAGIEARMLCRF